MTSPRFRTAYRVYGSHGRHAKMVTTLQAQPGRVPELMAGIKVDTPTPSPPYWSSSHLVLGNPTL
jgi:hypothetical protein